MSIEKRERKRKTAKGAEGQYDNEKAAASTEMAGSGLQAADFGSVEHTNLTEGVPDVEVENLKQFIDRHVKGASARYPFSDPNAAIEVSEYFAYDIYFEALNEYARSGKQVSLDMQEGLRSYNRRYLRQTYPNVANEKTG